MIAALDAVLIVSHCGVILWKYMASTAALEKEPDVVNRTISQIFLEDRRSEQEFVSEFYKVRWAFANEAEFTVVAVFPKFITVPRIDDFLGTVRDTFLKKFGRPSAASTFDFQAEFLELYKGIRSGGTTQTVQSSLSSETPSKFTDESARPSTDSVSGGAKAMNADSSSFTTSSGRTIFRKSATAAKPPTKAAPAASKKPIKKPTVWGASTSDPVAEEEEELTAEQVAQVDQATAQKYIKRDASGKIEAVNVKDWGASRPPRGRLSTWLRSVGIGHRTIEDDDLKLIIPKLREKLITKNVAVEVAEDVCSSIEASLKGKELKQFESLNDTIEASMVAALHRILAPSNGSIDILRGVREANAQRRPFVIVFCGVNGVGKSTTLSKVAYWLQHNGHSLMIAACDTFRSGAVEQLLVHGRCLDIPVFQQGLGVDASVVCQQAIDLGRKQKQDVILVDTAGRMQDHESRMRALAKLIHDNTPDLVLFVGEALVGNNGVDQLRKFNQCLKDYAPVGRSARGIDGIVLTKFDTIDDKVGAALSMVYELGQPIVFVGVGQSYQDLKTIDASVVIDALMSS